MRPRFRWPVTRHGFLSRQKTRPSVVNATQPHVQGYRAGGKLFPQLKGETLEALAARVQATAVKPPNEIVVATQCSE